MLFCLASSIAVVTVSHAKDVDERKWILVKSENFTIHSSLNAKRTENLLLHMEALRALLVPNGPGQRQPESKPTNIFVFGKASDYDAFDFRENSAGVFLSGLSNNFIAIRSGRGSNDSQVILHEYVHFIIRSTSRFPYPKWWQEGFAEYVSTSRLSRNNLDVGMANRNHMQALKSYKLLPWADVIDSSKFAALSKNQTRMFYAQAWFLTHHLHNRGEHQDSIDRSWNAYLEAIKSGASPSSAFEEGFDLSVRDLDHLTREYSYQYTSAPIDRLVPEFSTSVEQVSQTDIRIALGRIAIRTRDSDKARNWFEKVLDEEPENAAAMAGLAMVHQLAARNDDAEALFKTALDRDNSNPRTMVAYAKFAIERASMDDTWFTAIDYLNTAERLLRKAKQMGTSTVEVDTYLALTYLNQGRDPAIARQLLEAVIKRSPSDQMPLLLLAQICQRLGEKESALELANLVLINEHEESPVTFAARRVIANVNAGSTRSMGRRPVIAAPSLPNVENQNRYPSTSGDERRSLVEENFLAFLWNI
jgi:Tfp pilus assembly protein PilF